MSIDPNYINSIILIILAFGGAFLAALWLALLIWTWRDIRNRARDPLSQALAVLVVAALNLPGVLIYMILRPGHTLEEEYQRTLEEEALLVSIEDQTLCPGCERRIRDDWQVCPNCHTKLKKSCHQCGKLMELPWNICPYCGNATPGMKIEHERIGNFPSTAHAEEINETFKKESEVSGNEMEFGKGTSVKNIDNDLSINEINQNLLSTISEDQP